MTLIVRDVNTMYLVAVGVFGIAVKGTPSETCGAYKKVVENPDVQGYHADSSQCEGPSGHTAKETTQPYAV